MSKQVNKKLFLTPSGETKWVALPSQLVKTPSQEGSKGVVTGVHREDFGEKKGAQ